MFIQPQWCLITTAHSNACIHFAYPTIILSTMSLFLLLLLFFGNIISFFSPLFCGTIVAPKYQNQHIVTLNSF